MRWPRLPQTRPPGSTARSQVPPQLKNAQAGKVAATTVQMDEIRRNTDSGEDAAAARDVDGLLGKENNPTQVCTHSLIPRTASVSSQEGQRLGNSPSNGRQGAVVEELASFEGAGGAIGSPRSAATQEKTEERDSAGGVCARTFVATLNASLVGKPLKCSLRYLALTNVLVWSLPVLTSDRHALRHVADHPFSARGNLHRDLDLAVGRPAVLAHTKSSGY
eukprot:3723392-Pleurochrysis_carterae.AAC.3